MLWRTGWGGGPVAPAGGVGGGVDVVEEGAPAHGAREGGEPPACRGVTGPVGVDVEAGPPGGHVGRRHHVGADQRARPAGQHDDG